MKRIHIAIAVADLKASMRDYTSRLGQDPCCIVDGTFALWRTDQLNLSIRVVPEQAGRVRHLGFEDSTSEAMTESVDADGLVWERFTVEQQRDEILQLWPHAKFSD